MASFVCCFSKILPCRIFRFEYFGGWGTGNFTSIFVKMIEVKAKKIRISLIIVLKIEGYYVSFTIILGVPDVVNRLTG